jgi:hypothetical protein
MKLNEKIHDTDYERKKNEIKNIKHSYDRRKLKSAYRKMQIINRKKRGQNA